MPPCWWDVPRRLHGSVCHEHDDNLALSCKVGKEMGNGLGDALRDLSSRGRPYGPERVYRLAVEHGRRRDRRRRFGTVAVGAVTAMVVFGLAIRAGDEPP